MKFNLKKWVLLALCCVPLVAILAIGGMGLVAGGALFGAPSIRPWGVGLAAVALLICPLHMGWMMWRMQKRGAAEESAGMMTCCPSGQGSAAELDPSARLQALRSRRKALEDEIADATKSAKLAGRHKALRGDKTQVMEKINPESVADVYLAEV